MKKWQLAEVATGLYGVTPRPVVATLMVANDDYDAAASSAVNPITGELFAVQQIPLTHEGGHCDRWYKGHATSARYSGMQIPVSCDEDCDLIAAAAAEYKKLRRRCEDALRKNTSPAEMREIASLLHV